MTERLTKKEIDALVEMSDTVTVKGPLLRQLCALAQSALGATTQGGVKGRVPDEIRTIAESWISEPDARAQIKVRLSVMGMGGMADAVDEGVKLARFILTLQSDPPAGAGKGWIAVGERLPEHGQTVIVWGTDTNGQQAGWALDWKSYSDHVNEAWLKRWQVTHWQPLPAPPPDLTESKGGEAVE